MQLMFPFCSLLMKEAHFGFRHLLSVYKRLDEVKVFENQLFTKIIRTVAIGDLRL